MKIANLWKFSLWFCGLFSLVALSACSSRQYVNLKIHSEPEGSHLVYKITKEETVKEGAWMYLGLTPFSGVSLIEENDLEDGDRISFKVMHNGYLDQIKEWNGAQFIDEFEENGVIFWTPRLIKSNQ